LHFEVLNYVSEIDLMQCSEEKAANLFIEFRKGSLETIIEAFEDVKDLQN